MARYLIAVDTGTSNTRVSLWDSSGRRVAVRKAAAGVRDTAIDGNNQKLKSAIRQSIEGLLADGGCGFDDVAAVYGSGMLTSNVGLAEVPHLTAPALPEDFCAAVRQVRFEDVCPLPIHLIPGMKNLPGPVSLRDVGRMDIMRGEETEAIAVLRRIGQNERCLLALPGSHNKFISVDADGRLTGCLTTLSGELLAALTERSILADAVGRRFVQDDYRPDMALQGYRTARRSGLSHAAFSTRILSQFVTKDAVDCANFLLGAVLHGDIEAMKANHVLAVDADTPVIVAGKDPMRTALADLLRADGSFRRACALELPPDTDLAGEGAFWVARMRGDI